MTLPSIPFIWKQLNGPQIVGITRGIFGFIKSRFDSWMSYFWDFSVSTMNSEHLTTTGSLVYFARPSISVLPEEYFKVTTMTTTPTGYGFDDGLLAELNMDELDIYRGPLPTELYRALINSFTRRGYSFLSLKLLDDMMYVLREKYGTEIEPYAFEWVDRYNVPDTRHVGDIIVYLGRRETWKQTSLVYQALIGIRDNIFTPEPVLFFDLVQPPKINWFKLTRRTRTDTNYGFNNGVLSRTIPVYPSDNLFRFTRRIGTGRTTGLDEGKLDGRED